jgi:hypothetical protein
MGRGLASADIDLDGDVDMLITTNGNMPLLLRNEGGNSNNSLRLTLRGSKSNRDAIGAVVWGEIKAQVTDKADKENVVSVRRRVRSGSSYLSQSELPVTLGLGEALEADVVIRWPSGKLMRLQKIKANQALTVHEEKGILLQSGFKRTN